MKHLQAAFCLVLMTSALAESKYLKFQDGGFYKATEEKKYQNDATLWYCIAYSKFPNASNMTDGVQILRSDQKKGIIRTLRKMIHRRSAIEPGIGHMKMDGRLGRNPLKGHLGDALHAVLCRAGHNIRLLLRKLRLLFVQILMQRVAFTKPNCQRIALT